MQALDTGSDRIEILLLDLARVHQWTAMYAPGHPFLLERVGSLHASLVAQARNEPSGVLLFGIARDKVLYRDRFFEARQPSVVAFAEGLYRHHVATIGFTPEVTPEGMVSFFRCLRDLQTERIEEIPEGYLQQKGLRGIHLSSVDYNEVLSRGIIGRDTVADAGSREEELWRALLSGREEEETSEQRVAEELAEFPEILPIILRRARCSAALSVLFPTAGTSPGRGKAPAGGRVRPAGEGSPGIGVPAGNEAVSEGEAPTGGGASAEEISPGVLQRMFQRLGQTLKGLPEERRRRIFESLEEGLEAGEGDGPGFGPGGEAAAQDFCLSVASSLAEGYADAEFLELLAGLLSTERKGGQRLLRAFRIIAEGRDVEGSLLPLLDSWSKEGRHAKSYYAGKTWEAVRRLLLDRSEEKYLGDDHSKFLESLSGEGIRHGKERRAAREIHPAFAPFFDPKAMWRKRIAVLIDLLPHKMEEGEFMDLLSAVREEIPRLIEGREFPLLKWTLDSVDAAGKGDSAARREAVLKTLAAADFYHLVENFLSGPDASGDGGEGLELLVRHGAFTADPLLDRLLVEPDKGTRRILLSLLVRIGEPAVPLIVKRHQDLPWYFLRNLCFLLGEIGASAAAPWLVRMLGHKEHRVRRESIQALGKLRATDPDAVSALGRILLTESLFASQKEESVRIDAASALFRIGGVEALSYLHRGKACRRAVVREHCDALLRTRGRE